MKPQATVTYLFHSGFAVETAGQFLIFDYYSLFPKKLEKTFANGFISGKYLAAKSNVYVFASHAHGDHYDPVIWDWSKEADMTYILSSDIPARPGVPKVHSLAPDEKWADGNLEVLVYGSSDAGASFLVKTTGLSIFHAGDLNWWHWSGETPEEQKYAENLFKTELHKLIGQPVDIAFFPVDRRLEESYSLGAEYFAEKIKPQVLFPMHFGTDYGATAAFKEKSKQAPFVTYEITRRGQQFSYPPAE